MTKNRPLESENTPSFVSPDVELYRRCVSGDWTYTMPTRPGLQGLLLGISDQTDGWLVTEGAQSLGEPIFLRLQSRNF
jgi:hypothetical protein